MLPGTRAAGMEGGGGGRKGLKKLCTYKVFNSLLITLYSYNSAIFSMQFKNDKFVF